MDKKLYWERRKKGLRGQGDKIKKVTGVFFTGGTYKKDK